MKLKTVVAIVTVHLLLICQIVVAGSISDTYTTGDTLTATMLDNIKSAVNDNNTNKVSKSGDTMTGALTVPGLSVSGSTSLDVLMSIINADTSGTERLYFGTGSGAAAGITVWGSTHASTPGKWRFFNNKTSGNYDWVTSGAVRMTLDNAGNLGIGTATPARKLHVNGTAGGTSAYEVLSDAKYKNNVAPLQDSLQKVLQLQGVSFEWRTADYPDINFEDGPQIGFIAQEVEQVVPEVVKQDVNGNYSVAYSSLVPVLVEAIKEQQKEIEALKAELKLLSGK